MSYDPPRSIHVVESLSLYRYEGFVSLIFHMPADKGFDNVFRKMVKLKKCGHLCSTGEELCCRCCRSAASNCKVCEEE